MVIYLSDKCDVHMYEINLINPLRTIVTYMHHGNNISNTHERISNTY